MDSVMTNLLVVNGGGRDNKNHQVKAEDAGR
jgi:hypothetical protein